MNLHGDHCWRFNVKRQSVSGKIRVFFQKAKKEESDLHDLIRTRFCLVSTLHDRLELSIIYQQS